MPKLTSDQVKAIDAIRESFRAQVDELREQLRDLRHDSRVAEMAVVNPELAQELEARLTTRRQARERSRAVSAPVESVATPAADAHGS